MSETPMKKVKKEEPDDDDEIQIVHVNLRVPIVIPNEPFNLRNVAGTASSSVPAATAAAAAPPTSLALDAQQSALDQEYLRGSAPGSGQVSCPRCCYDSSRGMDARKLHYKRHHYDVYYRQTRSDRTSTPLTQWMAVHFGEVLKKARVCMHCEGDERYCGDYRSRADLIRHIQQTHPLAMIDLSREYSAVSSNLPIADADVHGLLVHALGHQRAVDQSLSNDQPSLKQTEADDLTQIVTSADKDSTPIPLEVVAAAESTATALPLDAPPSPIDEDYWRGLATVPSCPRCGYGSTDGVTGRTRHYKRHHYNVYYEQAVSKYSSLPHFKWMAVHFGNVPSGSRSCVLCEGDMRYWSGHRSRADLIRHMDQAHPLALLDLAREYSSNGVPVADRTVHGLLMNALNESNQSEVVPFEAPSLLPVIDKEWKGGDEID